MPAQDEHRRWNVTRLELQAWRNFSRQTEIRLGARAFFIGPNASGKSNILDALRFLRDLAGDGLQGAVAVRGGMSEIRSLHTRRFPGWLANRASRTFFGSRKTACLSFPKPNLTRSPAL